MWGGGALAVASPSGSDGHGCLSQRPDFSDLSFPISKMATVLILTSSGCYEDTSSYVKSVVSAWHRLSSVSVSCQSSALGLELCSVSGSSHTQPLTPHHNLGEVLGCPFCGWENKARGGCDLLKAAVRGRAGTSPLLTSPGDTGSWSSASQHLIFIPAGSWVWWSLRFQGSGGCGVEGTGWRGVRGQDGRLLLGHVLHMPE